jgi:hypothetical protein
MSCPSCGAPAAPGSAFCENCGADLRGTAPPPTAPVPPQQPYAQQPYAQQPPYAPQPAPGYVPPGYPPAQQPPYAPAPPAKRSAGAVVGIVVAVVLVLGVLGVGGYLLATGALAPKTPSATAPAPSAAASSAAEPTAPAASPDTSPTDDTYVVVTDAEARQVVTAFMGARLAMNVAASKQYCTPSFLAGEMKPLIDDKYWRPDSYQITKLTPDQMYIHVTVMGDWPSGREATIYSVYREPTSGKVLIDGTLDPEFFPELVTP